MAGLNFNFDPVDGFVNTISYPDPSNDTEGRTQVQSLLNQLRDALNLCATIAEVQGITLGDVIDGSITDPKLSGIAGQIKDRVALHHANTSNPHAVTAAQVGAIPTTARNVAGGVQGLDITGMPIVRNYEVGTYTGDGNSSRLINLGYRPKAVYVFPQSGTLTFDTAHYGGLALDGSPCQVDLYDSPSNPYKLIEVVSSGFNVIYVEYFHSMSYWAATNKLDIKYHYVVLR